jgi:hypothetical protein
LAQPSCHSRFSSATLPIAPQASPVFIFSRATKFDNKNPNGFLFSCAEAQREIGRNPHLAFEYHLLRLGCQPQRTQKSILARKPKMTAVSIA